MTIVERQIWKPNRSMRQGGRNDDTSSTESRGRWMTLLGRGVCGNCPVCGRSRMFAGYLAVIERCAVCATPLASVPADDAPPWVTMFIALHILIGLVVLLGRNTTLGTGGTILIVLPSALLLCLMLLRPVKGAIIAILLKLGINREDQEPT